MTITTQSSLTTIAVDPDGPYAVPQATKSAYLPPGLDITHHPHRVNSFDGFIVSGRAWGSKLDGARVEVKVAGVSRSACVLDGKWVVRFENGALARRSAGAHPVTARLTDGLHNTAQLMEFVMLEEFVDSFVAVDHRHRFADGFQTLLTSGELGLGTHDDQSRELVVLLVRDDSEGVVVATGVVEPGWRYGEWNARIPLTGLPAGDYRVRAQLMDQSCATLTRVATGSSLTIR